MTLTIGNLEERITKAHERRFTTAPTMVQLWSLKDRFPTEADTTHEDGRRTRWTIGFDCITHLYTTESPVVAAEPAPRIARRVALAEALIALNDRLARFKHIEPEKAAVTAAAMRTISTMIEEGL